MKIFKPLTKKIIWINAASILFFLFALQSCEDTTVTSCTGCPASSPYSTSGSSSCYATLSDCQTNLGFGCSYCR